MSFDAQTYARQLVEKGVDPDTAADVARKSAEARRTEAEQAPSPATITGCGIEDRQPPKKATKPSQPPKKAGSSSQKITRAQSALTKAAARINDTPPCGNDLAFNHGILCQVGLPRSKVSETSFLRKSGDAWVHVQAGFLDEGNGPVQQPVPYGSFPRLALAWVSTYAVRHKTPEIHIGESAAEFLRLMGKDDQGARYKTLRAQMHALAACRLQMGFKGRTYNAQPVERFDAWLSERDSDQRPLWPGTLRLSDSFYSALMESPVPLDNRALDALSGSALALDVYCWLAHRLHRIEGRPVTLHWKSIREQFAQEYQGKDADKDFKKRFLPALRNVLMVYPAAKVKQVTGGLLLMASPPPVPYKG